MSCCINRRKPVPERTDRGGTLRYAWLRAPPLHRMQKITSKLRLACLTQKASYEGGQRRTCAVSTISADFNLNGGHAEPVIGRAYARPGGFAHPTIQCLGASVRHAITSPTPSNAAASRNGAPGILKGA